MMKIFTFTHYPNRSDNPKKLTFLKSSQCNFNNILAIFHNIIIGKYIIVPLGFKNDK